jgi:hypothetical protein
MPPCARSGSRVAYQQQSAAHAEHQNRKPNWLSEYRFDHGHRLMPVVPGGQPAAPPRYQNADKKGLTKAQLHFIKKRTRLSLVILKIQRYRWE